MLSLKIDIKKTVRFFIISIFTCLIVSCSNLGMSDNTTSVSAIPKDKVFDKSIVISKINSIDKFTASGVIGIRFGEKAESANYIYTQDGDKFSIKLYGPLGIGGVRIYGDNNQVSIQDADGNIKSASNIKTLMLEQLGWYVPISGLKYWIKGIRAPLAPSNHTLSANNLTQSILQNGWYINYKNYVLLANKYPLPTKVFMNLNNLSLKVIIKSWQIN